jgi:DNA-binding CsgD family transcriptional regulator
VADHTALGLTAALQRVGLPAYLLDRDGVITWGNDAFVSAFGGDVLGRHYTTIVAPEDIPLARRQVARKLLGVAATDYEVTLLDRRRQLVRVEISSVPVDRGGRCDGVFGVARITGTAVPAAPKVGALTPRQSQVLELLAAGSSTQQIADSLTISRETVRNHIRYVLRALRAHSRLEAVANARTAGLLGDD